MQCFVSGRGTGKTTQLIKLSHDTGIPIMTRNKGMANHVEYAAMLMGVSIPRVLVNQTASFVPTPTGKHATQVIVDEAGGVLKDLLGVKVSAVAINGDALRIANPAIPDLEEMGLIDLVRTWRKARKRKGGKQ